MNLQSALGTPEQCDAVEMSCVALHPVQGSLIV